MTISPDTAWFPQAPEEITTGWLTEALRSSGALDGAASVAAFVYEPVGGGYVGENGRLTLEYAGADASGAGATAPRTMFVKLTPPHGPMKEFARALRAYEREVLFYRDIAGRTPVRAPRSFFAACDADAPACALLLEDMAPARTNSNVEGCPAENAHEILRQVARMHATWWESPEVLGNALLRERGGTAESWQDDYQRLLPRSLEIFAEYFSEQTVRLARALTERVPRIIGATSAHPATLVHSDIHVGNAMFPTSDGGEFSIVDWQLIRVGRGVEDVSRLLFWSMHPEERRAHERALLETYHSELVAGGVRGYDFETCWQDYRVLCLFQWLFGAITAPQMDLSSATGQADVRAWGERVSAVLADCEAEGVLEQV